MKTRKKRSLIWTKYTDDEFRNIVMKSKSYSQILMNHFGLENKGHNNRTLKARIKELEIVVPFTPWTFQVKKNKIPLNEILSGNTPHYNTSKLKYRLYKEGLKQPKCEECGLEGIWNNKPLTMHLDHRDGISSNHKLENLRILCPNCHSQTNTYCGKNLKKPLTFVRTKKIYKNAPLYGIDILAELNSLNKSQIAKKYGVSETAVRKKIKKALDKPK